MLSLVFFLSHLLEYRVFLFGKPNCIRVSQRFLAFAVFDFSFSSKYAFFLFLIAFRIAFRHSLYISLSILSFVI